MRHFFQLAETQKSARALDGVNSAKHASQSVTIFRIFLQPNEFAVQSVQVLVTLRQKILDDVAIAHRLPSGWTHFRNGSTGRGFFYRIPSFCTPQPVWRAKCHGWPVDLSPVFLYIVRSGDLIRRVKRDRPLFRSFQSVSG